MAANFSPVYEAGVRHLLSAHLREHRMKRYKKIALAMSADGIALIDSHKQRNDRITVPLHRGTIPADVYVGMYLKGGIDHALQAMDL
jgi:hypothetical protein